MSKQLLSALNGMSAQIPKTTLNRDAANNATNIDYHGYGNTNDISNNDRRTKHANNNNQHRRASDTNTHSRQGRRIDD